MNFNMSSKPDYKLQGRLTHELIRLYGIAIKLMLTEKLEADDLVFGDYSSIKIDKEKVFELYALPENSEQWDDMGVNFSEFGMLNVENIRLFLAAKDVHNIFDTYKPDGTDEFMPMHGLQNNLVILPNDKIMEITHVEFKVEGINNLYAYKDDKNVYKISLKPYHNKLENSLEELNDSEVDPVTYEDLTAYFDELTDTKQKVQEHAKVEIDKDSEKVVVDTADSVFGRF